MNQPAPATPPWSPAEGLRQLFRCSASGVYVVTTVAADGRPMGFTASSVTSVSLDPAVISFSLQAGASSWPAVETSGLITVHALSVRNEDLAATFATSGIDRFATTAHSVDERGIPLLEGTNGWMRCTVRHTLAVGQSRMVLAEVHDAAVSETPYPPLVHSQRGYWQLAPLPHHEG